MSNHAEVYQQLIEILNSNTDKATNSFDGFKTVEIIEKIYRSGSKKNY